MEKGNVFVFGNPLTLIGNGVFPAALIQKPILAENTQSKSSNTFRKSGKM